MSLWVYYTTVNHNDQMQCLTGLSRLCTLWLLFPYNYCPDRHKERHCFLAPWRLTVVMWSMRSNEKEWKWSYVTSQMTACHKIRTIQKGLLWNLSVGVEDTCGHALWANKILCYHTPLRSKRRLPPNHVLSWSYLIMCNLSNFLLWQHGLKKINSA